MELRNFLSLVIRKKQIVLAAVLVFLLLATVLTFSQPLEYRATSKLIIVQNDLYADAYSASKANVFLSNILSEVIFSNSFLEQVLESGYRIDKTQFPSNQNNLAKKWKKMISARSVNDAGVLVIDNYNKDKYQASQINQAIVYTLKAKHTLYHGLGDKVSIKIIDKTSISDWPVKPNILLNLVLSILLGLLVSFSFIYLYPETKIKFWPNSKKKKTLDSTNDYRQVVDNWQSLGSLLDKKKEDMTFNNENNNEISVSEPSIEEEMHEDESNDFSPNINNLF